MSQKHKKATSPILGGEVSFIFNPTKKLEELEIYYKSGLLAALYDALILIKDLALGLHPVPKTPSWVF